MNTILKLINNKDLREILAHNYYRRGILDLSIHF